MERIEQEEELLESMGGGGKGGEGRGDGEEGVRSCMSGGRGGSEGEEKRKKVSFADDSNDGDGRDGKEGDKAGSKMGGRPTSAPTSHQYAKGGAGRSANTGKEGDVTKPNTVRGDDSEKLEREVRELRLSLRASEERVKALMNELSFLRTQKRSTREIIRVESGGSGEGGGVSGGGRSVKGGGRESPRPGLTASAFSPSPSPSHTSAGGVRLSKRRGLL
mmetsp:Transcript_45108/g.116659  ORF Transcript_45108/g.116659 Transcript_45108/m.116659 type:complete len:219 (-) Transcript_45108:41-697(-)